MELRRERGDAIQPLVAPLRVVRVVAHELPRDQGAGDEAFRSLIARGRAGARRGGQDHRRQGGHGQSAPVCTSGEDGAAPGRAGNVDREALAAAFARDDAAKLAVTADGAVDLRDPGHEVGSLRRLRHPSSPTGHRARRSPGQSGGEPHPLSPASAQWGLMVRPERPRVSSAGGRKARGARATDAPRPFRRRCRQVAPVCCTTAVAGIGTCSTPLRHLTGDVALFDAPDRAAAGEQWYGLSDEALEAAVDDRLSFRRFAGIPLSQGVPDHSSVRRFREQLASRGLAEKLLADSQSRSRLPPRRGGCWCRNQEFRTKPNPLRGFPFSGA